MLWVVTTWQWSYRLQIRFFWCFSFLLSLSFKDLMGGKPWQLPVTGAAKLEWLTEVLVARQPWKKFKIIKSFTKEIKSIFFSPRRGAQLKLQMDFRKMWKDWEWGAHLWKIAGDTLTGSALFNNLYYKTEKKSSPASSKCICFCLI